VRLSRACCRDTVRVKNLLMCWYEEGATDSWVDLVIAEGPFVQERLQLLTKDSHCGTVHCGTVGTVQLTVQLEVAGTGRRFHTGKVMTCNVWLPRFPCLLESPAYFLKFPGPVYFRKMSLVLEIKVSGPGKSWRFLVVWIYQHAFCVQNTMGKCMIYSCYVANRTVSLQHVRAFCNGLFCHTVYTIYRVINCCLFAIFKHCWATTESWENVLGVMGSPGISCQQESGSFGSGKVDVWVWDGECCDVEVVGSGLVLHFHVHTCVTWSPV